MQFAGLAERPRLQIKEWLFTQLLASLERDRASGLFSPKDARELSFSSKPRAAIRLAPPTGRFRGPKSAALEFPWCPFPVSPETFSGLVDGLILFSAALLFSVTSLAITQVLPSWPLAVALVSGVTGVFIALYWFLFSFWSGITPGQRLAKIAGAENTRAPAVVDDRPQFR